MVREKGVKPRGNLKPGPPSKGLVVNTGSPGPPGGDLLVGT